MTDKTETIVQVMYAARTAARATWVAAAAGAYTAAMAAAYAAFDAAAAEKETLTSNKLDDARTAYYTAAAAATDAAVNWSFATYANWTTYADAYAAAVKVRTAAAIALAALEKDNV